MGKRKNIIFAITFLFFCLIPLTQASAGTNQKAAKFIAGFEGYSATCYNDPAGYATIGYGHLLHLSPCNKKDRKLFWSKKTALKKLALKVKSFSRGADKLVKVPINSNMKIALTSLTYNIGLGAFKDSTLLKKLNKGNYKGALRQFKVWNKAVVEGRVVVLPGLVTRRAAEAKLFRKGGGKICIFILCRKVFD